MAASSQALLPRARTWLLAIAATLLLVGVALGIHSELFIDTWVMVDASPPPGVEREPGDPHESVLYQDSELARAQQRRSRVAAVVILAGVGVLLASLSLHLLPGWR
jgi:hypothetical protein